MTPHISTINHMRLTNESILAALSNFRAVKLANDLKNLRLRHTWIPADTTDDQLTQLFKDVVSCFQKKAGKALEHNIEAWLTEQGIPYKAQVQLNNKGVVVGFGKKRGSTIPDIVFGNPAVGTHISQYIVMSIKISTRERDKLDGYFHTHAPKLFLYASLDDDYPHPEVFEESDTRKLICATPKKDDTRKFKLGFQDIETTIASVA